MALIQPIQSLGDYICKFNIMKVDFGLTLLFRQALINSDYPVILAVTLIGSFLVMASNLLVDLLYGLIDPRVSVEA